MFGFLKNRRELREAQRKIGVDLHRQVLASLKNDDAGATARLSSSFTVGYILAFVGGGFDSLGIDEVKDLDARIRDICDGVIPGKLFKVYSNQSGALELARRMKDQDKKILNTGLSPSDVIDSFALGVRAGTYDAPLVSLGSMPPDNLRRFLLNETLKL